MSGNDGGTTREVGKTQQHAACTKDNKAKRTNDFNTGTCVLSKSDEILKMCADNGVMLKRSDARGTATGGDQATIKEADRILNVFANCFLIEDGNFRYVCIEYIILNFSYDGALVFILCLYSVSRSDINVVYTTCMPAAYRFKDLSRLTSNLKRSISNFIIGEKYLGGVRWGCLCLLELCPPVTWTYPC